jgi:tetratricopeptide (TPR) repeat protein
MFKKSLLMIGLTILSVSVFAQSVTDAGTKYNDGNNLYNAKDYAGAITTYSEALEIAKLAGPEADELKGKIETQLTNSYLKQGVSIYKKDIDGAIATLDKGYAFASELNDTKSVKKFASTIAQLRTKKGDNLRDEERLDEAFAEYEMALNMKANYPKALYGQGMVFKEKEELDKMTEKMDMVIKYGGDNPKMQKIVAAAKANAARSLLAKAAEELNGEKYDKASEYIEMSLTYAPFDEGTMAIFDQIAEQAIEIEGVSASIKKAKETLN